MTNPVYNYVAFLGPLVDLEKVNALFQNMEKSEPKTPEAQWPPFFIEMPERFFKNIEIVSAPGGLLVSYDTDLVPNPRDLVTIGAHFNLRFESSHIDPVNSLFARCRFDPGKDLLIALLENEDLGRILMDPKSNACVVDNIDAFEHIADAINAVLKEKLDFMEYVQRQLRGR